MNSFCKKQKFRDSVNAGVNKLVVLAMSDDDLIKEGKKMKWLPRDGKIVSTMPCAFYERRRFVARSTGDGIRRPRVFYVLSQNELKHHRQAMSKSVLIADDSASMRLAVRFLLERRHSELTVQEAVDGVDAIEKAKETKPDLILLDLAMPRLNGAEAATVLKHTLPETPTILFTMYTDLHADALCGFIGVGFISKVDGVPKLLERVDALLPPTLPDGQTTVW